MNILLLTAHSIAEYDDLRMLTDLGYTVFSIGAYTKPHAPGDDKRPALPQAPYFEEFENLCGDQMAAKEHLPNAIIDWADVIICHHYPERWLYGQWARIAHKRVIWRTCGQSNPILEDMMRELTRTPFGRLEIVRYSPKEKPFFEGLGHFAGEDATIRFGKYRSDYPMWNGDGGYVANVTQNMLERGNFCGAGFYLAATNGIDARPAGPGSERLPGGVGPLATADMYSYLADASAYLYTGTFPASYTLGLIEAMFVGVPVVSVGPRTFGAEGLFEGHELAHAYFEDPADARADLLRLLARDHAYDRQQSDFIRGQRTAVSDFDVEHVVGPQWKAFLG